MGDRLSKDYILCDTISDILSSGTSSRLYQNLVKNSPIFSNVNAYISGNIDPSLFIVCGYINKNISVSEAEKALWKELKDFCDTPIENEELEKVKNKFEANTLFGELNVSNKAMNLCYYEMIGDIDLMNSELTSYRNIEASEISDMSKRLFTKEHSTTLIYESSVELGE